MSELQYKTIDHYDRVVGALDKLPDVTQTKPSTIETVVPITGESQTWVVTTYRQREVGDHIALRRVEGGLRLVIPPAVAKAIAAQYDALGKKNRRKAAKAEAARRKAAGIQPGFLKVKKA